MLPIPAATFYLIHFVICCIYGGFPTAGLWWASTLVSLVACALVSEFACMRWEMAEIPLAGLTGECARAWVQSDGGVVRSSIG